jgi:hypothetical protein
MSSSVIKEMTINLDFIIKEGVILIDNFLDDDFFEQLKTEYIFWDTIRNVIRVIRNDPYRNCDISVQSIVKNAMHNFSRMETHFEFVLNRLKNIIFRKVVEHKDTVCHSREGIALLQLIIEYSDFIKGNTTTQKFLERDNMTWLNIKINI